MKKSIVIISLSLIMLFSSVFRNGTKAQASPSDEQQIEQTVRSYFETSYDQFNRLEYPDLSDILDMTSIQCQNKVELFKDIVDNYKYCMETGWDVLAIDKLPYELKINSISVDGTEADVQFELKWLTEYNVFRDENGALHQYPFFMTFGTNYFHLNNRSGQWKIDRHDNPGYGYDFDLSREEVIPYDKEKSDEIRRSSSVSPVLSEQTGLSLDLPLDTDYSYAVFWYHTSQVNSYAYAYCTSANSSFYVNPYGDCCNFVSQCLAYGFGNGGSMTFSGSYANFRMIPGTLTTGWRGDSGGGVYAWENSVSHWNYMFATSPYHMSNTNLGSGQGYSALTVQLGDVMQLQMPSYTYWHHSIMMLDNNVYAQHSPNQLGTRISLSSTTNQRAYHPIALMVVTNTTED